MLPEYTSAMLCNYEHEFRSRDVTLNASYKWNDTRFRGSYTKAKATNGDEIALPNSGTFMPLVDMATFYVDHEFVEYGVKAGASLAWAGKVSNAFGYR